MAIPITIRMDHGQIVRACYDWLSARGLEPEELKTMELGRGPDLVFPADGNRIARSELKFQCALPDGKLCWDDVGNARVHTTNEEMFGLCHTAARP